MEVVKEPVTEEAKAMANQGVKKIAAQIRKDIRLAKKAKQLPTNLKCFIHSHKFAGGQSIDAKLVNHHECMTRVKEIMERYHSVRMSGVGYPDPTVSPNYYIRIESFI